jgi:diguanylate cyclase (GGDEF)-like protein/PAS domain S-box-containing protein
LRVGVYENPPKITLSSAGDQPGGILGELLVEIAREEGWQLEAVTCQWEQCLAWLREGRIDLLPDVARSPERRKQMGFHQEPSLRSWSQLFSGSTHVPHSPLDLEGARIAVLQDSIQQRYLQQLADGFGVTVRFIEVATLSDAFAAAAQGRADYAVANQLFGDFHAEQYRLRPTSIVFQPVGLYYATPAGQGQALHERIDHWLKIWKSDENSPYYEVLHRWDGHGDSRALSDALLWALAGLGVLLFATLLFLLLLRRKVGEKTAYLQQSEQRLQAVLSSVEAYIFVKGTDYCYQYVNPRVCELFGLDERDILGRDDSAFFAPGTVAQLREADRRVIETGQRVVEEEISRRIGSDDTRVYLAVKQPLRNKKGEVVGLVGVSTDVTDRRRQEEQLYQLAFYDSLTELPNQQLLIERLDHAMASCARNGCEGAVLFIDLDNFRDLNDTLGHHAGNQLLVNVAERLNLRVREGDTLARFGGDEFVVVFEGLDGDRAQVLYQVEHLASVLLELVNDAFELDGQLYTPSASIGIALFSDARHGAGDMIKCAELAMYEAKDAGRNRYRFYDPSMQAQALARAELEAAMRRALNQHEFELHYQLQYDADGRLLGLESLVRWRSPERGLVSPAAFIPVAETSGLILPLGRWVLQEACEQLVRWSSHPQLGSVSIAVNISAQQMHDSGFVDTVLAVLEQTGADPQRLKLEITESLLVQNIEQIIAKMTALRAQGVSFSLDDFGTGYSSLSYLKRLPLDQLKIDQGFVRDLLTDPNDEAIVRTVIALGCSLDLAVIAEGVETKAQQEALLSFGCRQYQGYLFNRPLPAAEIEALLT